jgi:hypothetical protein
MVFVDDSVAAPPAPAPSPPPSAAAHDGDGGASGEPCGGSTGGAAAPGLAQADPHYLGALGAADEEAEALAAAAAAVDAPPSLPAEAMADVVGRLSACLRAEDEESSAEVRCCRQAAGLRLAEWKHRSAAANGLAGPRQCLRRTCHV